MNGWIDTHVHMDDDRYADAEAVRQQARAAGVSRVVIPAVNTGNFARVRTLARRWGDGYALGYHPMYLPSGDPQVALAVLEAELTTHANDPHLVAIGEIGLDYYEAHLTAPDMRERQDIFLQGQLRLARYFDLPVLLHSRRAVDAVLRHLRQITPPGGIAHAFVGSTQQAKQLVELGCRLGFGGALTYARANRLREQATHLPLDAIVLETDAPDIPPHWLHVPQEQRAAGVPQPPNVPAAVPRIGQVLADLRGLPVEVVRQATTANALAVLPRLAHLQHA